MTHKIQDSNISVNKWNNLKTKLRAVSSSGSTEVDVIAAEPVGVRATGSVTKRLVRATPIVLGHLHELGALPVLREAVTVLKGCSTSIHGGAGAANIIGHWTATTRTSSLMIRVTLIALGHLHELGPLGLKGAVSSSGSTEIVTAGPVELWGHWAAAPRA